MPVVQSKNHIPAVMQQQVAEFSAREEERKKLQGGVMTPPPASAPAPAPAAQPQAQVAVPVIKPDDEVKQVPAGTVPVPSGYETLLNNVPGPQTSKIISEDREALQGDLELARAEIEKLKAELENSHKLQEENRKQLDEYSRLKEQQEIDDYIKSNGDFNTLDPDDARRLITPLFKSIKAERDRTAADLAAMRKDIDTRFQERRQADADALRGRVNKKIGETFSDKELYEITRSPAYSQVMKTPIGAGSNVLVANLFDTEYNRGNAAYVLDVLNQVKAKMQTPSLNDVASVSGASTPAVSVPPGIESPHKLTNEEVKKYNDQLVTGRITRQQYREIMAKQREAASRLQ